MTIFLTGLLTCLALIVAIGAQGVFIMRQAIRRDRLALALAVCLGADLVMIFAGTAGVGVVAERAPWLIPALTWGGVVYLLWFAATSFRSAFSRRRGGQDPDTGPRADDAPAHGSAPRAGSVPRPGGAPALVPGDGDILPAGDVLPAGAALSTGASAAGEGGAPGGAVLMAARPVRGRGPARTVVLTALSVSVLNPHAVLDTVVMLGTLANSYGSDKWVFAAGAVAGSAVWFLTLGLGVRALAPVLDTPRTWRIVDGVIGVVMLGIAAKLALG